MNIDEIKDLLLTIDKTNLGHFKLQNGDLNIEVSKLGIINNSTQNFNIDDNKSENISVAVNLESEIKENKIHIIKSPLMGTFYESSSPDSNPFVNVGDKIDSKSTLCIIEAMKLMNELTSDVCGEVIEVLVNNEDLVEYNQPLFKIKLV